MITLPKNWEDSIQVRDLMKPINQFGEVGLLIFMVKNKDNQVWAYQYSLTVPGWEAGKANLKEEFEQAYRKLLYEVPGAAISQVQVLSYKDMKEHYEDITNDEWEVFIDPYLTLYKEFVEGL